MSAKRRGKWGVGGRRYVHVGEEVKGGDGEEEEEDDEDDEHRVDGGDGAGHLAKERAEGGDSVRELEDAHLQDGGKDGRTVVSHTEG